jgi:uncharacterized protein YbjT (DUF2867 family)
MPEMRTQIVSARTVAEVIAEVIADAAESPASGIIEVGGPREENLVELARMLAARRGTPVTVQGFRDTADPDAEIQASGGLLPGPGARLAGPTFAEWLDQK